MGDRLANLDQASYILESHEMTITARSSIYRSEPWGRPDQPWFLNQVLSIETIHPPHKLLQCCLETEVQMGRKRFKKWGQRIIDVDILYYNNEVFNSAELTLPHPGIPIRRFTLMPLAELAPEEIHPLLNVSQEQLLNICPDQLECHKTEINQVK